MKRNVTLWIYETRQQFVCFAEQTMHIVTIWQYHVVFSFLNAYARRNEKHGAVNKVINERKTSAVYLKESIACYRLLSKKPFQNPLNPAVRSLTGVTSSHECSF